MKCPDRKFDEDISRKPPKENKIFNDIRAFIEKENRQSQILPETQVEEQHFEPVNSEVIGMKKRKNKNQKRRKFKNFLEQVGNYDTFEEGIDIQNSTNSQISMEADQEKESMAIEEKEEIMENDIYDPNDKDAIFATLKERIYGGFFDDDKNWK